MAKLIIDEQTFDVKDGERFIEQLEAAGVPLGCSEGICGSCRVTVLEGGDNLSSKNQEELDFDLPENERLACQCEILKGLVKLKYY